MPTKKKSIDNKKGAETLQTRIEKLEAENIKLKHELSAWKIKNKRFLINGYAIAARSFSLP